MEHYEEIAQTLEVIAEQYADQEVIQVLREAAQIVRDKPYTRSISEVRSIVNAVRAGLPVQIDYYDPERDAEDDGDCSYRPQY
jgi:hypothetical protein